MNINEYKYVIYNKYTRHIVKIDTIEELNNHEYLINNTLVYTKDHLFKTKEEARNYIIILITKEIYAYLNRIYTNNLEIIRELNKIYRSE